MRRDSQGVHSGLVGDALSGHEIGNTVAARRYRKRDRGAGPETREALGIGNRHRTLCPNGATHTSLGQRPRNLIREIGVF